jgi:hypothetical protein
MELSDCLNKAAFHSFVYLCVCMLHFFDAKVECKNKLFLICMRDQHNKKREDFIAQLHYMDFRFQRKADQFVDETTILENYGRLYTGLASCQD